jgi:hypothetical protein
MGDGSDANHSADWQPATSEAGELYTPEGQIAATGAFARGLKRRYRDASSAHPSAVRRAAVAVALGAIVVIAAVLIL